MEARILLVAGVVAMGLLAVASTGQAVGADVCVLRTPVGSYCVSAHPVPTLVAQLPTIVIPTPFGTVTVAPCF